MFVNTQNTTNIQFHLLAVVVTAVTAVLLSICFCNPTLPGIVTIQGRARTACRDWAAI